MPSSITLTVSHLPSSTSFFLAALQPLKYCYRGKTGQTIGFGPESPPDTPPDFWITQEIPGVPAGAAHVAFPASSQEAVRDFFIAALKAGGKIHGEPSVRDAAGYYSAAVIDFDGNSIEAVFRPSLTAQVSSNARSIVSKTSVVSKSPSTIARRSSVSQTPSRTAAPSVAPSHIPSQAQSVAPASAAPETPKSSKGDIFDNLLDTAQTATNVARQVIGHAVHPPTASTTATTPSKSGDAVACTLLGIAAGAALHYAFTNRDKDHDKNKDQDTPPQLRRHATLPPETVEPMEYYEPSSYHSRHHPTMPYRTITAPASTTSGRRFITMYEYDNDSGYSSRRSSQSKRTSSNASSRRGSGNGQRLLEGAPPPTSYRAPSVLTAAETATSHQQQAPSQTSSRASSRRRSESSKSKTPSRSGSSASRKPEYVYIADPADDGLRTVVHITEVVRKTSSPTSESKTSTVRPSSRRESESRGGSTTSRTSYATARPGSTTKHTSSSRPISSHSHHGSRSHTSKTSSRSQAAPLIASNLLSLNDDGTIERRGEEGNGSMKAATTSVVGKTKDIKNLHVRRGDIKPCDSVSQC